MHITARIREKRQLGKTTCAEVTLPLHEQPRASADRAVAQLGLRALGDGWLEISAQQAHTIASAVLQRDLAHGADIMPKQLAEELATALFDLAPEPHRYFTNGDWDLMGANDVLADEVGFDPITDADFDAGVVCVGEGSATVLWVQDDD